MTASFQIRRLLPGDEHLLRAARLRAFTDSPEAFGSTLEREAARTLEDWRQWTASGAVFLIDPDAELGPRGIVGIGPILQTPLTARLTSMWIEPALRGSEAADALIEQTIAWAKSEHIEKIVLSVVKSNARATRCYERNGFKANGREIHGELTGRLEIEMQRDLA